MPRLTAASVSFACFARSTRSSKRVTSTRATVRARSRTVALPVSRADSIAAVIRAQAKQFLESLIDCSFGVFLLEGLLPVFGGLPDSGDGLIRGEATLLAVEEADSIGLKLRQPGANGDQVSVHQLDESAAQKEIETNESEKGG